MIPPLGFHHCQGFKTNQGTFLVAAEIVETNPGSSVVADELFSNMANFSPLCHVAQLLFSDWLPPF